MRRIVQKRTSVDGLPELQAHIAIPLRRQRPAYTLSYMLQRHVRSLALLQNFVQWLLHNPLATATVLYITGIMSVLVYTYFETRDQHSSR